MIVNGHLIFSVTHVASTGIKKSVVKWHLISFYVLVVNNIS